MLPDRATAAETAVHDFWDDLQVESDAAERSLMMTRPNVAAALDRLENDEVIKAIASLLESWAETGRRRMSSLPRLRDWEMTSP